MKNEILFIIHSILVCAGTFGAIYLGKYALISFICMQSILANLFVSKQITLFGLNATCSDAFIIASFFGLNMLQELWGREIAKKTIYLNFFVLIFYVGMAQIHVTYTPHTADLMHPHFLKILYFMPRIVWASILAFFISQFLDVYLFGYLKRIWAGKYLPVRNFLVLSADNVCDTIIFSFVGLYGIVDAIWQVICISLCIKTVVLLCNAPLSLLAKRFVKNI